MPAARRPTPRKHGSLPKLAARAQEAARRLRAKKATAVRPKNAA